MMDMMRKRWKRTVLIGLSLVFLLAACSTAAEVEAEFPYGSYKSRGGKYIELTEAGTWTFALVEGQPLLTGEITVDGREITFGDETPAEGQNVTLCEEHATYRWQMEEDKLTFEPVGEDPCDNRAGDLNATFLRTD